MMDELKACKTIYDKKWLLSRIDELISGCNRAVLDGSSKTYYSAKVQAYVKAKKLIELVEDSTQPEKNPLCEENENFVQNKFGHCFYALGSFTLIYNLYVHPQYRRKRHSSKLLMLVISEIRKSGYEGKIYIQAEPKEDSISKEKLTCYYKSVGLVIYEAHKPEQEEK